MTFFSGWVGFCRAFVVCSMLWSCGGGGSSPTSSPPPSTTPPPSNPPPSNPPPTGPTMPVVQARAFTLESLTIDSGPTPFVLRSPGVIGSLAMQASGGYTMAFRVAVGSLAWEQTVTGTHTFVGNTLRLTPDDSLKTLPVPFQQTVIIENMDVPWIGYTRVVISLPIRPGGFRAEDRIELAYVQGTSVTSTGLRRPVDDRALVFLSKLRFRE